MKYLAQSQTTLCQAHHYNICLWQNQSTSLMHCRRHQLSRPQYTSFATFHKNIMYKASFILINHLCPMVRCKFKQMNKYVNITTNIIYQLALLNPIHYQHSCCLLLQLLVNLKHKARHTVHHSHTHTSSVAVKFCRTTSVYNTPVVSHLQQDINCRHFKHALKVHMFRLQSTTAHCD